MTPREWLRRIADEARLIAETLWLRIEPFSPDTDNDNPASTMRRHPSYQHRINGDAEVVEALNQALTAFYLHADTDSPIPLHGEYITAAEAAELDAWYHLPARSDAE